MFNGKVKTNCLLILLWVACTASYAQFYKNYSYWRGNIVGGATSSMIWLPDGNLLTFGGGFLDSIQVSDGVSSWYIYDSISEVQSGAFMVIRDSNQQVVQSHTWGPIGNSSQASFGFSFWFTAPNGEIYAGGTQRGKVDYDPGPGTSIGGISQQGYQGFLMKFSETGSFRWVRTFEIQDSLNGQIFVHAGTIDGNGNIYLSGLYRNAVDFDPGIGTQIHSSTGPNYFSYILKLDSAGAFQDFRHYPSHLSFDQLEIGADGNLIVGGSFYESVDLEINGGTPFAFITTGSNFRECFLASYDTSWNLVFGKHLPSFDTFGMRVETDSLGDIYLLGAVEDTTHLANGGIWVPEGSDDVVVEKYDAAGNGIWSSVMAGPGFDGRGNLCLDGGLVYATFFYGDSLRTHTAFSDTLLINGNGTQDFALARLDAQSGGLLDLYALNDNNDLTSARGLVVRGRRVDMAFNFKGIVDLDPGTFALNTPNLSNDKINIALVAWQLPAIVSIPTSGAEGLVMGSTEAFPNPFSDRIILRTDGGTSLGKVKLFSLAGQLVKSAETLSSQMELATEELPSGLYLLVVETQEGVFRKKLVKE